MGLDWINSAAGERALGHLTDPRPAWLWAPDGDRPVWANPAALLYRAKIKKQGLRRGAPLVPIKGQVGRAIRLGAPGRTSLSRMRFLAGEKPVSATCSCTPLRDAHGTVLLLVVGVDPIDKEVMTEHGLSEALVTESLGTNTPFQLRDAENALVAASDSDRDFEAPDARTLTAGPDGARLALFTETAAQEETADEPGETPPEEPAAESAPEPEPAPSPAPARSGFASLVGRLSEDAHLYTPLGPEDDALPEGMEVPALTYKTAAEEPEPAETAIADSATDETEDVPAPEPSRADETGGVAADEQDTSWPPLPEIEQPMWRITGRGFIATNDTDQPGDFAPEDPAPEERVESAETIEAEAEDETDAEPAGTPAPPAFDPDQEKVSRYNFEELSRILADRIGHDRMPDNDEPAEDAGESPAPEPRDQGELINLSDEALVLNRLPLGLMIFRDQEIVFANRALTELVGYPDTASLRRAGMSALFPTTPETGSDAGPITHLAHRDGTQVPVAARLQTITWQGRPAFLLSARAETGSQGVEAAVRGFAETLAATEGNGFFETSRAGIIDSISGRGAALFKRTPDVLIGRPILALVAHESASALRGFFNRPARFAETSRPSIVVRSVDPRLEIVLFAEGQAGIVTGYFGIVQPVAGAPAHTADTEVRDGIDPAILSRLSRGIRRPLNAIVGFAELIRSNAFGPIENPRYNEYARDIKFAGKEITGVLDELEDFVDLNSGSYRSAAADFDLGILLDTCMARVRHQAGQARVLVRSAISERLPHIRADEASLGQAILNLLASAISQTPQGGQVVLSAQREDDGAVVIHVRDSGTSGGELAERFVVFRDGTDETGERRAPVQSSVGLALTRSLLAVNTCSLSVDLSTGHGTLLSLTIPAELAVGSA